MINLWPRSICDCAVAAAGAAVPVFAGAWATGSELVQPDTATATGINASTATRDKHKRMSLHSSVKGGYVKLFANAARKYTPTIRLRLRLRRHRLRSHESRG